MKAGDVLTTDHGTKVILIRIESDPNLKPLVVRNANGQIEYYHYKQIKECHNH